MDPYLTLYNYNQKSLGIDLKSCNVGDIIMVTPSATDLTKIYSTKQTVPILFIVNEQDPDPGCSSTQIRLLTSSSTFVSITVCKTLMYRISNPSWVPENDVFGKLTGKVIANASVVVSKEKDWRGHDITAIKDTSCYSKIWNEYKKKLILDGTFVSEKLEEIPFEAIITVKDFLGKEAVVGDEVIFTGHDVSGLIKGKIISIGKSGKTVTIEHKYGKTVRSTSYIYKI